MLKSHKLRPNYSFFRPNVRGLKEKLLTLRSEFHLRRKESLKFSRRQETSTFPDQKHYVKTRRPIAHTRYRGVGIGGIQQSSRWRCARPTVFLLFIQRCFAPLSTRWIRTEQRLRDRMKRLRHSAQSGATMRTGRCLSAASGATMRTGRCLSAASGATLRTGRCLSAASGATLGAGRYPSAVSGATLRTGYEINSNSITKN